MGNKLKEKQPLSYALCGVDATHMGLFPHVFAPSVIHKDSLNDWMQMKRIYIRCCGFHSHQIATQENTYRSFYSDLLDRALHYLYQNTNIRVVNNKISLEIFWKNCVIIVPEIV